MARERPTWTVLEGSKKVDKWLLVSESNVRKTKARMSHGRPLNPLHAQDLQCPSVSMTVHDRSPFINFHAPRTNSIPGSDCPMISLHTVSRSLITWLALDKLGILLHYHYFVPVFSVYSFCCK